MQGNEERVKRIHKKIKSICHCIRCFLFEQNPFSHSNVISKDASVAFRLPLGVEGIFCRDFKEKGILSLCLSLQKPTRKELPVDIELVSEIVTELKTSLPRYSVNG